MNPIEQERNSTLDVLKGICCLFVITTHFKWTDAERLQYFFPFWIDMAVPVFMLVSGYTYSLSFKKRRFSFEMAYSPNNWLKRIIRYVIPFTVAFAANEIMLDLLSNNICGGGVE